MQQNQNQNQNYQPLNEQPQDNGFNQPQSSNTQYGQESNQTSNQQQLQQQYIPPPQQQQQQMPIVQGQVVVQGQPMVNNRLVPLNNGPVILTCQSCQFTGYSRMEEDNINCYSFLWCFAFGLVGCLSYSFCDGCRENHGFSHYCSRCGTLIKEREAQCL